LAVKVGNLALVRCLIEGGACPSSAGAQQLCPLHLAASCGWTEVAQYLVESANVDLNPRNAAGCTPLYQAVQHGHFECSTYLVATGADIEARTRSGASPLYIAADRGNLELVKMLLEAGAEFDVRTDVDMTAFLVAAFNGRLEVLQYFLSCKDKVNLEQCGPSGGTALYMAAQEGHMEAAECLLKHGALVDARSEGGLTPSLIAAMQGHARVVALLLQKCGEADISSDKGTTLATMAAQHGQVSVLQVLVDLRGAKPLEVPRADGVTALSLAKKGRHKEAAAFIERSIAAQKELEMLAWEASLPELLQDLSPEKPKKAKRPKKAKAPKEAEPRLSEKSSEALPGSQQRRLPQIASPRLCSPRAPFVSTPCGVKTPKMLWPPTPQSPGFVNVEWISEPWNPGTVMPPVPMFFACVPVCG